MCYNKVASLSSERDAFATGHTESKEALVQLEQDLKSSQLEVSNLLDKIDGKSRAG